MRKNDAKWYSQILWNCFRIQFRPVHIRGSIPKTRVCFVTPPTFKSSVLTLRHVTNFDISVRERKERKGLKNRQGYACESIRRRKDGWSWYWLAFADAGAEFSTSLPSSFHLHPLSIYIYVYHSSSRFLFPSSTRFPPYKYTLRLIPSISFLLSSTISSVRRTNLPLSPSLPSPSIPKLYLPPHLFLSPFFFIYV